MSEELLNNFQAVVWIQPDGPNTEPQPLLCSDIDGIDEPQGDVTSFFCRQGDGSVKAVHRTKGGPGDITYDIVLWRAKQRSYLQKVKELGCPVPVYLHWVECGRFDTFLNYELSKLLPNGSITNKSSGSNARGRRAQGEQSVISEMTFSLSCPPPSEERYKLVTTISAPGTETEPLRDIVTCSVPRCASSVCGPAVEPCDELFAPADAGAGVTANVYRSANNAASWAATGADPFAADEDVASAVCFMIDGSTERLVVARGTTDAGNPAEIAYSDNNGTTWTPVNVGSTNGEYAMHSGALFALDHRHIWLVTSEGNVYFSDDGALTWTNQNSPAPGAAEGLWYVHFIDHLFGMAVGGDRAAPTCHIVTTTDGGEHWTLLTTEPQVELAVAVRLLDHNRAWVVMDDGSLWYSNDFGATWSERVLPTTPTNLGDIDFWDEYNIVVCGYTTSGAPEYPTIWRSIDGGFSWEVYVHTTAFTADPTPGFGLNAVKMCSANEIHTVGNQLSGAYSAVWTLKPAGWS